MRRKICVVTGSRAEYGLMKPLIGLLQNDKFIQLQIIATGAHVSSRLGMTSKEIRADGFKIDEKIDIDVNGDTGIEVAESMGLGLMRFAKSYKRLQPDIVIGMGDRFEIFSAFAAAFVNRIPLAHLSGGEITEGAFDDAFRHAMTKMSSLHFVSNEEYRHRVIQLGEQPSRVFKVGEVGLDRIKGMSLLTKEQLEEDLRFSFKTRNILVTFHPVTLLKQGESLKQLEALLGSLATFPNTQLIFTKANADPEGQSINGMLEKFVAQDRKNRVLFSSLGSLRYLSLMKEVDVIVGNSSSALVEAPSLQKAAVNVGDRQNGRLKASNVIDCHPVQKAITKAIARAYTPAFKRLLKEVHNPYGDGRSAQRIINVLKKVKLEGLLIKKFYDL
ncbi:MAG: UDP-N-acetylglucosamine 2-epimerase (hydrolyzing) [Candidatus Omnitrophica bacterium]|nr:UDP-N-acetylglucosamine 2-epimerase (hydrolyzing) [Candidatus Omnitrophota bacterium]